MYNDLVVIELASVLAGPAVGMFFAELGARVIKVENSETMGDVTRSWRLSSEPKESDISSYFSSVNWGKQSIAVNATVPEGRQIVYDLVRNADIVISSYNPGDDKKLALDYDTLSGINSQLIYGHVTGYGKEDPRAGYDAILQAAGEFTYLNGAPEGSPVKMPVALIDLLAAHQLKEALLLALIRRMESGGGGYIHTSLLQSGIASLANQAANWLVAGHIPERSGSDYPNIGPYGGTFKTRDEREVMLSVGNDQQFRKLCAVLGRPELAAIPLYSNNSQRVKNREKLNRLLADQILKFNREELIDKLTENNVPTGGILNMKEVFEQKASEELIIEGSLAQQLSSPPHLNEHAKKILREDLKYNAEKIKNLKRKGAIMWV
jgi:crotonobetainyl-CoA:carnitine CoA-transferase CaiB-like acyl-CoA transferase